MKDKKKIFFVIPSLAGGGAERVMIYLLQYIDRTKFEPWLVVLDSKNNYGEEVPKDIKVVCLNKKGRLDFFRLTVSLSKLIRKEAPSLVCSFLEYANYLVVLTRWLSGDKIPLFLSERTTPSLYLKRVRFGAFKKTLTKLLYPKAEGIIAVSKGVKEDLLVNFRVVDERCKVIYNPIDIKRTQLLSKESIEHPWFKENIPIIVACGNLTVAKNYPMLLKAMKLVLNDTEARLVILGTGEEHIRLESYTKEVGIHKNVSFLGFQKNPFKFMAKSTIFVLSSSWEGFANVLLEAMACGLPVISTRCASSPNEIITSGVEGLLVPVGDEDAMAKAILRLLKDESLRKQMSEAGKIRVEDFRIKKIVKQYEEVFWGVG
ncbi:MAG: glycosyltransferase [Candidatus Edwardsbacteria bacterium]